MDTRHCDEIEIDVDFDVEPVSGVHSVIYPPARDELPSPTDERISAFRDREELKALNVAVAVATLVTFVIAVLGYLALRWLAA